MIELDTKKMKEYGNDIIELSQVLNELIQTLYTRIINIPTVTMEWQGISAIRFAEQAKKDKVAILKTKQSIYKCGEVLIKNAENYETKIKELVDRW